LSKQQGGSVTATLRYFGEHMVARIKVKSDGVFRKVARALRDMVDTKGEAAIQQLFSDLVLATPIRTGYARSRWTLEPSTQYTVKYDVRYKGLWFGERKVVLSNDAPYIIYLNQGSSKQAPAYFIEQTILSHGFSIDHSLVKTGAAAD
jgi:hypothetical protein